MTEKQKLNLSISEGGDFFAHETSVNFNPTQFTLDFRCITPRVDPRTKEAPVISLKHNVIMIDPWHAKEMQRILNNAVENYEKKFGKIDQPKAVKKFLKEQKKNKKEIGRAHV